MSERAVEWRVESGRWLVLHRGVYLTEGTASWGTRAVAAFLAARSAPDDADVALAGATALHVAGLTARAPSCIDLVVPHGRRVTAPAGVRLRRCARFEEIVAPRTYPWRTVVPAAALEAASTGDADHAVSVVATVVSRGAATAADLAGELAARGRHRHGVLLREVLLDVGAGAHSPAEVRYVRDVERAHGLPQARRQVAGTTGPWRRHDNVYVAYRLVVEVDGRLGHEAWSDRVRDGRRDRAAAVDGGWTTRVFWPDVAVTPCDTAVDIGGLLRAHGWTGSLRPCRRRSCAVRSR
ncbi:hypothetical protein [Phycicoccus avicenniae]|nr:hypothetical protein [Phycicoccus avicenniae]